MQALLFASLRTRSDTVRAMERPKVTPRAEPDSEPLAPGNAPVHDGASLPRDASPTREPARGLLVESPCASCGLRSAAASCAHCGCARVVAGYRVERVLAETERGRVYLAAHQDGSRVALKELVFATVPGAAQVDQFHREARVLQALSHPAIPKFVDAFQTGAGVSTRLYLAQEFVEGESLLQQLAHAGRIGEAQAKEIARQVLSILEHLHGLSPRLIHRDLKPANLIQRLDGRIALVDFDAARALQAQRTHGASIAGTFGYSPLEQLGGTVDATSDLYALGATLIHLLSGKAPQELLGPSMELQFAAHVDATPGFLAWLQRMTAREHAARFVSAKAADAALRALDAQTASNSSDKAQNAIDPWMLLQLETLETKRDPNQRWAPLGRMGTNGFALIAGMAIVGALVFMKGTSMSQTDLRAPQAASLTGNVNAWSSSNGRPREMTPQRPVVWHSHFGDVNVKTFTFDPATSVLAVVFTLDRSPGSSDFEQMQAHLMGPGGRVEILRRDKIRRTAWKDLSPSAQELHEGLQTIYFQLAKSLAAPTTLVFGDSVEQPLDLESVLHPWW